jgi:purine-binding chemotaxis protein CheW
MTGSSAGESVTEGYVHVTVGAATFGVPVLRVQDVIVQTAINRVPLAPPEVAGSLNLRGRIVTAIDMRLRLGMPVRPSDQSHMCVIVEYVGELYALLVDEVGDVLWLGDEHYEAAPVTLSPHWRAMCQGLFRLEDQLMLVLDVDRVLKIGPAANAA